MFKLIHNNFLPSNSVMNKYQSLKVEKSLGSLVLHSMSLEASAKNSHIQAKTRAFFWEKQLFQNFQAV